MADHRFKQNIALLCDAGGGKTSLLRALRGENFNEMPSLTYGIDQSIIDKDSGAILIDFGRGETPWSKPLPRLGLRRRLFPR